MVQCWHGIYAQLRPEPLVKGISYQDYGKLLHDKNLPLINRVTQGLYPPARQRLNPIWRCPRC